jgi:predicted phosphate transport protein (TIGR00153 family)
MIGSIFMLTIAKLFGKSPFAPLQTHMDKVASCIQELPALFQALVAQNAVEIQQIGEKISRLEHEADLTKNDIRNHLPKSLFLQVDRSSLLNILSLQDELADQAEKIAFHAGIRKLDLLPGMRADFLLLCQKIIEVFLLARQVMKELEELLECSFGGIEAEKVKGMVEQIAFYEYEVTQIQNRLIQFLYRGSEEMAYPAFHLWLTLIAEIGELARIKRAVFLAAILEFSGAFFVGSSVTDTIQKGIINPEIFTADPSVFVLGMMGSLLATGVLLQMASYFGLPISTTHAIVGAVIGFGAVIGGIGAVHWDKVGWITMSWILSPVLSGIVAYWIFGVIQRKILYALNPIEAAQKLTPYFVFLCLTTASMSLFFHGHSQINYNLSIGNALSLSVSIGLVGAFISHFLVQRIPEPAYQLSEGLLPYQAVSLEKALHHLQRLHLSNPNIVYEEKINHILGEMRLLSETVKKNTPFSHSTIQYHGVEKIFIYLQILSACLVAFAHGANDVANAIGPVAAVLSVLKTNTLTSHSAIPSWLLALGGSGIVIGLATWGWRVIETIGKKITELTPTRGFSAEFGAAITILFASKLGLPISTTHALVGAVLGVGLARGLKALNLQTLKDIVLSWIVTLPLCALFSIIAFHLLKMLFLRVSL